MCTDLSSAIDVNSENFLISNTHQLIQADINDLPFVDNQFDIVICLGVVQHTPSPEETIKNLMRPFVYIYGQKTGLFSPLKVFNSHEQAFAYCTTISFVLLLMIAQVK